MKNKFLNNYEIFKYLISNERYKITFLIMVFMCIYGRLCIPVQIDLGSAIITPLTFPLFHYVLLVVFTYNTMMVCKTFFGEFNELFIRYRTKKEKIKIVIFNVFNLTLFSLLIFLILYFSIIIFTYSPSDYSIVPYNDSSLICSIYYIIKISVILILFQIINALFYFLFEEKLIVVVLLYFIPFYLHPFSNINKFYSFAPWLHQLSFIWSDLNTDILSFTLCIFFLIIILFLLYKICRRKV